MPVAPRRSRRRALRNFAGWADEADCTSGWRELVGWLLGLESELHDDEALRGVLRRAQGGDRVAWRTVEAWGRRVRGRGKGHRLLAGWLGAPRFWRAGMKGRPRELFEFASSLCPRQRGARWIAPAHFPSIARRASLEGLDMSAMKQTPYAPPSREDSAKSRYTITPPPPDYTDADGMRWYPCDRADESLARPIPGTARREIVVAAPAPTRARRRSPARRARTSTDAPPAPWRSGVALCDERIDAFRVMLSKRPTAAPPWRCLHCSTENEPVVDWCRLCRAGRIRVSLAIAS